ncbi:MAG TPA: guanylate kinase [Gaiellaceae bacterium]|nr:guanylate kinase [Gaiellaceae bacterium]
MGSSTARPVFVITGTSGEGKSTLARRLVERMPELQLAVSATTRPQRPGEENGQDYWFIADDEFDRRLAEGDFLEWIELPWGPGYRSGTLLSELERIRSEGRAPLLEIETTGALAVRDRVVGAVTFFVTAPSKEELEHRLRSRATESEGEIDERLAVAEQQLELESEFDYRIVNDDLERAFAELEGIVRAELDRAGSMAAHDSSPR